MDGTFLNAKLVQTLLLCVGIDVNGHNVLLVWAIVESESSSAWEYFFEHLKLVIPQLLNFIKIGDCRKGLNLAD